MSGYLASLSGIWLIDATKAAELARFAELRLAGWRADADTRQAYQDAATARLSRGSGPRRGSTAVIPVQGTLVHRGASLQASSGAISCEAIGRAVDDVANDDAISAVIFDIDSPGGHVEGVPELGAKIRRLTGIKRTVAAVNAMCASAAYWLASQTTEITITPSGMAGSIGVVMVLRDESAALDRLGVKVHAISGGTHKVEGASFQALSADSRAHFQTKIDRVYRDFVATVATGRHVPASQVLSRFGQGRVFDAEESLARGMVDVIEPFDETLARVSAAPAAVLSPVRRAAAAAQSRQARVDQDMVACTLALLDT